MLFDDVVEVSDKAVSIVSVTKTDVEDIGFKLINSNQLDEIANKMEYGCMLNYRDVLKIACEDTGLEKN